MKKWRIDKDKLESLGGKRLAGGGPRTTISSILREKVTEVGQDALEKIVASLNLVRAPGAPDIFPHDILADSKHRQPGDTVGYIDDWPTGRPAQISFPWFSGTEKSILRLLTAAIFTDLSRHEKPEVTVVAPPRLGHQKTVIYLATLKDSGPTPRHFIARIGPRDSIEDERDKLAAYHGQDSWAAKCPYVENELTAGLAYPMSPQEVFSRSLPVTLKEALEEGDDVQQGLKSLLTYIAGSATSVQRPISWWEDYVARRDGHEYLWFDAVEDQARQLVGRKLTEPLQEYGRILESPWKLLQEIRKERPTSHGAFAQVHGDMHLRNIVLTNKLTNAFLIDFQWCDHFHRFVDAALLEASLKVFYAAKQVSDRAFLELHDDLHNGKANATHGMPKKCYELVSIVRDAVGVMPAGGRTLNESLRTEYYASSFLVTLGRLAVPTCNMWKAWLSASWFADQLKRLEWKKSWKSGTR